MFKKCLAILTTMLALTEVSTAGALCSLSSARHNPGNDITADQMASSQMMSVKNVLCQKYNCPSYLFFQNPTLQNAMATADQRGYAIRYNARFTGSVYNQYGQFSTIGIFAHELGHIIDFANNPGRHVSQRQREATADEYAGCAFALNGNASTDLAGMAATLHAMGPSPGYPTPQQRIQLLQNGYQKCSR